MTIRIGQQVVLKSGGPPMTVVAFDASTQMVTVTWFDSKDSIHTARLDARAVTNE